MTRSQKRTVGIDLDTFAADCMDFVEENWADFVRSMLERGYDEAQVDACCAALKKRAGRS